MSKFFASFQKHKNLLIIYVGDDFLKSMRKNAVSVVKNDKIELTQQKLLVMVKIFAVFGN